MKHPSRVGFFLLAPLFLLPGNVHAATFSFETLPGEIHAGDTVVVRAYLDSGTDDVNALDGEVTLTSAKTPFSIAEVSSANSAFSVWAKNPTVSADGKIITFTGGTPGGIPKSHALLLSIVLTPKTPGTIAIDATKAVAYKNDGKGTVVPVTTVPFSLSVGSHKDGTPVRDQWKELVGSDTTPPAPFAITLGSDSSVFDGKKFITFSTTDTQSGIDRYEVTEGALASVRSDMTYVLKEQNAPVSLTVRAYDKAGNVQTATLTTERSIVSYLPWLTALVVLLAIASMIVFLVARKKRL